MKRRILLGVAGFIAFIILALVSLPFLISSDMLKTQLIAQVKKATGRELEIKGKTSLTLFPNIAISAEDVTLGNPQGFASPYFAHIGKLETGAALSALFEGRLEITGVTLDEAVLHLEENKAGAKNWEFTVNKARAEAQKNAEKSDDAAPKATGAEFILGDVTVNKSAVHYQKAGAKTISLSELTFTLRGADGASPLALEGHGMYKAEQVKLVLGVEKTKAFLARLASPVTVEVALPSATVRFAGTMQMGETVAAQGALKVAVADLPRVLAWASDAPASAGLPKQITLASDIQVQRSTVVALSNLTAEVDGQKATGKLSADLSGAVPALRGQLALAVLDLDRLTSVAGNDGAAGGAAPAAAEKEGWSTDPIDLAGLKAMNMNLDLALAGLKKGALTVGESSLTLAIQQGVGIVTVHKAALYGGDLEGRIRADGNSVPIIGADLTLGGVSIEKLVTAFSGSSRLSGTADMKLSLSGRGGNERDIMSTLAGNGAFTVKDGAVKGVNLAQLWREVKKGQFFSGGSEQRGTDFSELSASFTVTQGVLNNQDLSMRSPALRVTGSGSANLPARSVNYRLVPAIVGSLKGQGGQDDLAGVAVPLMVTGPWSNPQVTPDLAGMVREGLKNPEALKQNVKAIGENLKNFNSPKDLKKAFGF